MWISAHAFDATKTKNFNCVYPVLYGEPYQEARFERKARCVGNTVSMVSELILKKQAKSHCIRSNNSNTADALNEASFDANT